MLTFELENQRSAHFFKILMKSLSQNFTVFLEKPLQLQQLFLPELIAEGPPARECFFGLVDFLEQNFSIVGNLECRD